MKKGILFASILFFFVGINNTNAQQAITYSFSTPDQPTFQVDPDSSVSACSAITVTAYNSDSTHTFNGWRLVINNMTETTRYISTSLTVTVDSTLMDVGGSPVGFGTNMVALYPEFQNTGGNIVTITTNLKIVVYTAPAPMIAYSSNDACKGSMGTILTATTSVGTAPFTYQWFDGNANLVASTSNFEVPTTNTGSLTFSSKITDANSCVGTALFTVSVWDLPEITLSNSYTAHICAGESRLLTSSVIASNTISAYQWYFKRFDATSNTFMETLTTSSIEISSVRDSGTYYLTATDALGCKNNSAEIIVHVYQRPVAPQITNNAALITICYGSEVQIKDNQNIQEFYNTNAPKPIAALVFIRDYYWYRDGQLEMKISPTSNAENMILTKAGNYSLVVVDPNTNCPNTGDTTLTIAYLPTPTISFSSSRAYTGTCGGEELPITVQSSRSISSIEWLVDGTTVGAFNNVNNTYNTYTFTNNVVNTYTLSVKIGEQFSSQLCSFDFSDNPFVVTIVDDSVGLTYTAEPSLAYCENSGASVTLELMNNYTATYFGWTKDGNLLTITTNNILVIGDTLSDTGNYSGFYLFSNNCTKTAQTSVSIRVYQKPYTPTINVDKNYFIEGSSVELTVSANSTTTPQFEYQIFDSISPLRLFTKVTAPNNAFSANKEATYYAKIVDDYNCMSPLSLGTQIYEIKAPIDLSIAPHKNPYLVYGDVVTLTAVYFFRPRISSVLNDVELTWYKDGVEISTATSRIVAQEAGMYTVKIKVSSFEDTSAAVEVIYYSPAPTLNHSDALTACLGMPVTLEVLENADNYQWFKDGTKLENETSKTLMTMDRGTYHATIQYNGTEESQPSAPVDVSTPQYFQISIVNSSGSNRLNVGDSVQLRSFVSNLNVSNDFTYEWASSTDPGNSQLTRYLTVSPKKDTTYTLKVTHASGCYLSTSIDIDVFRTVNQEILERAFDIPLLFTPNNDGVNDRFFIEFLEDKLLDGEFASSKFQIYDTAGTLLTEFGSYAEIKDWNFIISGSKLPTGSYFFILDLGSSFDRISGLFSIIEENRE